MKGFLSIKTVVFIIIIGFFFVPYFGPQRLFKLVYAGYIVTLFSVFFAYFNYLKLNGTEKLLCLLFCLCSIWIFFSISLNALFFDRSFSATDYGEISRPLLNLFIFTAVVYLTKYSTKKLVKYIFIGIVLLSLFNLFLSFIPKVPTNAFDGLIEIYGEGKVYSKGYAVWRAFGVTGQPGKNALLATLTIIALLKFLKIGFNKWVIYVLLVLNIVTIFLTISRIGLLTVFLALLIFFILNLRPKIIIQTFVSLLFFALFVTTQKELISQYYHIDSLFRGGISEGGTGTFGMRMGMKVFAFDVISNNPIQMIFGVGPSKEYLSNLSLFGGRVSLAAPDSSYTLWLVRYGIGGVLLFSAPYIAIGIAYFKRFKQMKSLYVLLCVLFFSAQLDPVFHEPKIQTLTWLIIALNISRNEETSNHRFAPHRGN